MHERKFKMELNREMCSVLNLVPLKQRQKWVKSNHNWLLQTDRGSGQDFESSEQGHSLFLFD